MKRSLLVFTTLSLIVLIGTSTIRKVKNSGGIQGYTGAPASSGTCNQGGCHSSFALNSNGSVSISGIPATFQYGVSYPFSITITHTTADRKKFGYDIVAMDSANAANNSLGTDAGSFATTAANSMVDGTVATGGSGELTHSSPPKVTAVASKTITGFTWKAPVSSSNISSVVFYFTGNASNGDAGVNGDYIYSGSFTTRASVAPVTLNFFKAALLENQVALAWQTATQINTDYFEIEKSTDRKSFVSVGKIKATDNSTVSTNYSFVDAISTSPIVYYRLKTVDKNGFTAYSDIKELLLKSNINFVKGLYPNPLRAGNDLKMQLVSNKAQKATIELYNTFGKKLNSIDKSVNAGENLLSMNLGHFLAPGVYYLSVVVGTEKLQQITLAIQ